MRFHVICQQTPNPAQSPLRVVEHEHRPGGRLGQSLSSTASTSAAWRTRFAQLRLQPAALCSLVGESSSYRRRGGRDLTESTLLDYVKFQSSHQPPPSGSTINDRVAVADRALRNEFPDAPCQIARGFHQAFLQRRPMGLGRPRIAMSRLRVKVPKLHIVPLSVEEVARFWSSFRTARDLAIVGLMLLQGLRSAEVLALNQDDVLLSEAQLRVRGKGNKLRFLPLAPETVQLLDHYLRLERPESLLRRALRLAQRTRARRTHDAGRITFLVPLPSPDHRRPARQPPSLSTHLCLGHGTRRHQPARAHAVDGSCRHPDYPALCAGHPARRLPAVCARGGPAPSPPSGDSS